jgi:hypothetical protein
VGRLRRCLGRFFYVYFPYLHLLLLCDAALKLLSLRISFPRLRRFAVI